MYTLENVNFKMVKNKIIQENLKDIEEKLILHKHLFLTERIRFNGLLELRTTISFISEDQQELNIYEQIIYKPLTIENFLYCSLDEMLFDCKICLTLKLNEIGEKHYFNFFNLNIVHGTYANFLSKESYFKHIE